MSLKALIKMGKEDKDIFYVEIRSPNEVKRDILESLKDIVESLQRFEKFKELRKEKNNKIDELKSNIKEINKLISNLKEAIPDYNLRDVKFKPIAKKTKKVEKKIPQKEVVKKAKRPATELEKLESELGSIEEKLKGLQ